MKSIQRLCALFLPLLIFAFKSEAAISGRVLGSDSRPVAGVRIVLGGAKATTDTGGRFLIVPGTSPVRPSLRPAEMLSLRNGVLHLSVASKSAPVRVESFGVDGSRDVLFLEELEQGPHALRLQSGRPEESGLRILLKVTVGKEIRIIRSVLGVSRTLSQPESMAFRSTPLFKTGAYPDSLVLTKAGYASLGVPVDHASGNAGDIILLKDGEGPALGRGAISADNPFISYLGRLGFADPKAPEMQWPGTTILAEFQGTSLTLLLQESTYGSFGHYLAIVDGDTSNPVVLTMEAGKTAYPVVSGLKDGRHSLRLVRLGGAWQRITSFKGLVLDDGKGLLRPPARSLRKIEFFGDSITEGSYMGDDQPGGMNNFLAYGYRTALALGADYRCIAQGGLGLIKGYALPRTLPNIYDRLLAGKPNEEVTFSAWVPQVVLINIMQNDKWTLRKADSVSADSIRSAYKGFVRTLRKAYPEAHIICLLGPMDASGQVSSNAFPGYVRDVVGALKAEGDERLSAHIFPFIGATGHPNPAQHADMARQLIPLIRKKTGW